MQTSDELDLENIDSENKDEESEPPEFEIATYPADYTLEVLVNKIRAKEIIVPPFQRKFVWTKPQASRLIESFMLGLPVPQIFLYTDKDQKSIIIDGQQRLKTIFYFFDGYFDEADSSGSRKVFKLEGINEASRWFDKTFEDLSDSDKRKLKNCVLRAIIVKQLDPKDDRSIYHVFERLNTGGTLLKNQEIRNCIYAGLLNVLIVKLNEYPPWRKLLGHQVPDKHQRDVELILRYLALARDIDNYQKPMKDFLSNYIKQHRNPEQVFLDNEAKLFQSTCNAILESLGPRVFRPRGPLNAAIFDSVFISFSKNLDKIPKDISERYSVLLSDAEFEKFTRKSTTDAEAVVSRLTKAERILFG